MSLAIAELCAFAAFATVPQPLTAKMAFFGTDNVFAGVPPKLHPFAGIFVVSACAHVSPPIT